MTNEEDINRLIEEKIGLLNHENLIQFEDIRMYIRYAKSDQYIDETLLELLEHLLRAQEEGKTAKDVFGDDLEEFCRQILEEIPKEGRKLNFFGYIGLRIAAIPCLVYGMIGFFPDTRSTTFYSGSFLAIIGISILSLYLFIYLIRGWVNRNTFKGKREWSQGLQIIGMGFSTALLFLALIYFMPNFGPTVTIPTVTFAGIGIILYFIAYKLNKKSAFLSNQY